MNKKTIISLWILTALFLSAAIIWRMPGIMPKSNDEADLTIRLPDSEAIAFTLDDIKAMKSVDIEVTQGSGGNPAQKSAYTGVDLMDILAEYRQVVPAEASVVMIAEDNYASAFSFEQIIEGGCVYIVYQMNGKELGQEKGGAKGPLMAVAAKEAFGNRNVGMLKEITIELTS